MPSSKIQFLLMESLRSQVESLAEEISHRPNLSVNYTLVEDVHQPVNLDVSQVSVLVTVHSIGQGIADCLKRARQAGVRSLTIQDGIIEYSHCWRRPRSRNRYRPVLSDRIAVMGRFSRDILASWGNDKDAIHITGLPRFDQYPALRSAPPTKSHVLVTCANTPFQGRDERESFVDLMNAIGAELNRRQLRWTARLPKSVLACLSSDFEGVFSNASMRKGAETDIAASTCVISTMSTMVVEAMAVEKPTAIVNPSNETLYLHTPWTISCRAHISTVLDELLNPPAPKLALQCMVRDYHLVCDGKSSQRLADLITAMAKGDQ